MITDINSVAPITGMVLGGYPIRVAPSTTAAGSGLINFIIASRSKNSTGIALIMRPAHSPFVDVTGAL